MLATLCFVLVSLAADQTTGHEILTLEQEVGAKVEDRLVLDALLTQAKVELVAPKKPNKDGVKAFLTAARNLVISQGFREAESPSEEPELLCRALQAKVFDCDTLSFILVSMAEELNFPLKGTMAPGHMFVIWSEKKEVLLWDSRSGEECEYAKAHGFLHLVTPLRPPYDLKPLSHKELVACGWYNVAAVVAIEQEKYSRALEISHEVIRKNPNLLVAQVLRGNCFQNLGNLQQAEKDYLKVIKKNPQCLQVWCAVSQFWSFQGDLDQAIDAISKAIEIAPDDADLYLWRGIKFQERGNAGDYELAEADFGRVLQLDPVFLAGHRKKK